MPIRHPLAILLLPPFLEYTCVGGYRQLMLGIIRHPAIAGEHIASEER